ncbi:aspartyl-phosphate phosphatase Spo0E family protein [Saccharibacillus sp. JS10]|uniref:aspartyl-phosphate phosphatase Spo0E family protein n=1 Tax=Saccharibacillus sp. JS10 TaxID=2950552 RepID=UPI00210AE3ED|nr:aspartyl-phosphate phosphatase Spo0E family protein [Saccharibacillus sp. JS10]MCQ4086862.1 aspartyl-phosphate phosphatase Spo0E family protein [Saccharibacillus sp. JS10]
MSGALAERELFLQEEIRILRIQIEETFVREQSFTAETVVEISSQLDMKINEYMQLTR